RRPGWPEGPARPRSILLARRRRVKRSARRLDLELPVLAEVVVVGDRADEALLARPQRHRGAHDIARVRGRGPRVLLLLVLAQRAVELDDRDVVRQASGVARDDLDPPGRDDHAPRQAAL